MVIIFIVFSGGLTVEEGWVIYFGGCTVFIGGGRFFCGLFIKGRFLLYCGSG